MQVASHIENGVPKITTDHRIEYRRDWEGYPVDEAWYTGTFGRHKSMPWATEGGRSRRRRRMSRTATSL